MEKTQDTKKVSENNSDVTRVEYKHNLIEINFVDDNGKNYSKKFNGYEELFEFIRQEFFHKTATFASICEYANDHNDYTILGYMRLIGRYFEQDYEHARITFVIATRKKCPYAACFLGFTTLHGLGCDKDSSAAKFFFDLALEWSNRKNSLALINLAEMYHEGLGVDKDELKRIELLKEAINLDNTFAKCDYSTTLKEKDEGIQTLKNALIQDRKNMLISHYFLHCSKGIDGLRKVRVSYFEYWTQCVKDGHLIPKVLTPNQLALEPTIAESKTIEPPKYQKVQSNGYTIHYKQDILVPERTSESNTQKSQMNTVGKRSNPEDDTNGVLVKCSPNVKGKIRVYMGPNMEEIP